MEAALAVPRRHRLGLCKSHKDRQTAVFLRWCSADASKCCECCRDRKADYSRISPQLQKLAESDWRTNCDSAKANASLQHCNDYGYLWYDLRFGIDRSQQQGCRKSVR